jgi:hypothetical protein
MMATNIIEIKSFLRFGKKIAKHEIWRPKRFYG